MKGEPLSLIDLAKRRTGGTRAPAWVDSVAGEGKAITYQVPPEPTEWILHFPYPRLPITPNGSHAPRSRRVQAVRFVAAHAARLAGVPPLGRARAELTWYVTTKRRRNPSDLTSTLRAMVSGIVIASITDDDTPNLMDTPMPSIVKVDPLTNRTAWMELRVTRWAGLDQTLDLPEP